MPEAQDGAVRLSEDAAAYSVDEQIALGDLEMRRRLVRALLWFFGVTNFFALAATAVVFGYDIALLRAGSVQASQRLVTTELLMTIIGATTVQVGVIMVTISNYLFPKRNA
jgi:hypothetical protein